MLEKFNQCNESKENIDLMDVTFEVGTVEEDNIEVVSSNVSFLPLENNDSGRRTDQKSQHLGTLVVIEDISDEKKNEINNVTIH